MRVTPDAISSVGKPYATNGAASCVHCCAGTGTAIHWTWRGTNTNPAIGGKRTLCAKNSTPSFLGISRIDQLAHVGGGHYVPQHWRRDRLRCERVDVNPLRSVCEKLAASYVLNGIKLR